MGRPILKMAHECGTRHGLQVFEEDDGRITGYCFSCGTFVPHPLGKDANRDTIDLPPAKTPEQIQAEIAEIDGYQCIDIQSKRLRGKHLEQFGIKVGLSEVDGKTPETIYYPYRKKGKITGYKVKLLPKDGEDKRIWSIGDLKHNENGDVEPFGWQEALKHGGRRLIITEGEDDAVAYRSLVERYTKEEWKDHTPAIISLSHGAGNAAETLSKWKKEITARWKEVILVFDMDKAGEEAIQKAMLILPEATTVKLPSKDVNQCIIDGRGKAAYDAIQFHAEKPKNSRLVFGDDLHEVAKEEAKYGELSWPWDHLNKKTRGIRLGETIYIGAGVKMGKSELLNELAAHFIKNHGVKVFMAKPEEANKKTYKLIAGKIVGRRFHDPDVEFDYEAYEEAGKTLKGKLAMVNLYQHLGWDSLRDDIIAAAHWGAKAVFIDPITNLTNGVNAADANTELQKIAQDLAAMALDLNIVVFIFCHLKAPDGNIQKEKRDKYYRDGKYIGLGTCPHELGGDVISSQFAGSRAMMRSCNMMLGLEGNKDEALDDNIKNIRNLVLLEDREFGETGRFPIFWNKNTTLFTELDE
jgi:twinkle protein